jgi:hypothetical protein
MLGTVTCGRGVGDISARSPFVLDFLHTMHRYAWTITEISPRSLLPIPSLPILTSKVIQNSSSFLLDFGKVLPQPREKRFKFSAAFGTESWNNSKRSSIMKE